MIHNLRPVGTPIKRIQLIRPSYYRMMIPVILLFNDRLQSNKDGWNHEMIKSIFLTTTTAAAPLPPPAETSITTTTRGVASSVQPDIYEIFKRLLTAPKLQQEFISSESAKCNRCQCNMESKSAIVQWEWLEFCSLVCLEIFITKHNHGCVICLNDCDFYNETNVSAHVYGNQLYTFCSGLCAKKFSNVAPFCQYCRRVVDPALMLNGFCHRICQQKFDALYATRSSNINQICCIECSLITNATISLSFAGRMYGFCSHRCYFYRTLVCALFPGIYEKS